MKRNLLFVEDRILHYDQAAGDRTSYMYLTLLLEMGFSVTFVALDYHPVEPYMSHLRSLGIKVMAGEWFHWLRRFWFMRNARKFDYVFFNRPGPTKHLIGFIEKYSHAKIIYQCHDLHYLRLRRQYEVDKDEEVLKLSQDIEKIELDLIGRSDLFLTFSNTEKEIIRKKLPNHPTEVIPLFFYDKLNPPIPDFSQRKGILYVGGFKHQPNLNAVLWFLKEIFPQVKKICRDLVFYIVGSHAPVEITELADDSVHICGYVSDKELIELYNRVKLVVVPLRFGAGVKGKTIEAIHYSLPLVSTSIGSEGIIGLEAIVPASDSAQSFVERVVALYTDETALKACSTQLHDYAKLNLTKSAAKTKMSQLFASII